MISYRTLSQKPSMFRHLCGLSKEEFDALCREWVHADAVARAGATHTREGQQPRRRAPGGGRKYQLDACTRLLAALVWLRLYPTWQVLGYLFEVEESAVRRSTKDVLARLADMAVFPLERRSPRQEQGRRQGRSLDEVLEEVPTLQVLIDSREQRIRRPQGWPQQKPFYSGKKKAHTLKSQAAVNLECRVQAISESVPGSTSDVTLLRGSGVIERLEPEEAAGGDKAYVGVEQDYPEHDFYLPVKKPPGGELSEEEKSYNASLSAVRIGVEHFFARMSHFGALSQVFRHRRGWHSRVVRVGAFLVDQQMAARQAAPAALALAA